MALNLTKSQKQLYIDTIRTKVENYFMNGGSPVDLLGLEDAFLEMEDPDISLFCAVEFPFFDTDKFVDQLIAQKDIMRLAKYVEEVKPDMNALYKRVHEADNFEFTFNFVQYFQKEISPRLIKEFEKEVIATGHAFSLYMWARYTQSADREKIAQALCATDDLNKDENLLFFAKNVTNKFDNLIQKTLIRAQHAYTLLEFAKQQPDADLKLIRKAIKKTPMAEQVLEEFEHHFASQLKIKHPYSVPPPPKNEDDEPIYPPPTWGMY